MISFKRVFRKKKEQASSKPLPTGYIADAFKAYINNEIPVRLIDTSKLRFVSRKGVLRIFQDKIAHITEEQIQERINNFQRNPFSTYQPRRETIVKQIIQEVVRYVILSHRWDDTVGEPSYRDVSGGPRDIARFKKLFQFCKTSRALGHKLAWVDTCCIDETNATEVSEAIHAMYKWYANSCLCIAYLGESTSLEDWDGESWFTRGWTLQELLAPKRLKFYSRDWSPFIPSNIADDRKHDPVTTSLHKITGICKAVLERDNSQGVQECNFWEIMSWASGRQTTRVEDRAYCLIGLLRVSLTISYGEGREAFPRLVRAIIAKNPSWDVFAWFGQPSVDHFALPPSPASYPKFETHISEDRTGIQDFSFTSQGLSLRSLPLIPLKLYSVKEPETPRKPLLVELRSQPNSSSGTYGNLVVECGTTRLERIHSARKLSACIINHHAIGTGARRRAESEGRLIVGKEYICFLLCSNDEEDDEITWMKLPTDNLLRISFMDMPETTSNVDERVTNALVLPLVRIWIQS